MKLTTLKKTSHQITIKISRLPMCKRLSNTFKMSLVNLAPKMKKIKLFNKLEWSKTNL